MIRAAAAVALGCAIACAAPAPANPPAVPLAVRRALRESSVLVLPSGCGGVLAASRELVATALHCVDRDAALRVRTSAGATLGARVEAVDADADQALLRLERPAAVPPLDIARRPPIDGTVVYFQGNPKRPRPQDARVDHRGRCESLPRLPDALFTSIRGTPGDSGSPLVDGAAQIVGLVHGGSRCQIATPATRLARLVDRALGRELASADRGGAAAAPRVPARS
jgi:S1-C subfamily serine protease